MKAVITGDISGFTSVPEAKREELVRQILVLMAGWVEKPEYARVFRGDSFQLLFSNGAEALKRSIQLRCWLKGGFFENENPLEVRAAIGIGEVSYYGKSVLDSDGPAFHLSGRSFDEMEADQHLCIVTADAEINKQLKMILELADILISSWSKGQSEVIFLAIEGKTQQQMAEVLHIGQSAVNNRIKLSRWKEIEKTIRYISELIVKE